MEDRIDRKDLAVVWSLRDAMIVVVLTEGCIFLLYGALRALLQTERIQLVLFRYLAPVAMAVIPILWLRRKGLPNEAVGLKPANWSCRQFVAVSGLAGLACALVIRLAALSGGPPPDGPAISEHALDLLLVPVSLFGFPSVVLAPVAEEILHRGVIYSYLRSKCGITGGLLLQALYFSVSHVGFVFGNGLRLLLGRFLAGAVLGGVFEASGSLYASIVCHAVMNYASIALNLRWA
jgi:hypothetical protein